MLSPAALTRRGPAEFLPSFAMLQEAVRKDCARATRWEAKVVAGIAAVIKFVVDDVAAASALTVNAGEWGSNESNPERELRSYFEELLEGVAPGEMLFPISSVEGIVETIAIQIRGHLLAGTAEQLVTIGPDLVYLTLIPYLGDRGARQWAGSILLLTVDTVDGRTVFDAWLKAFERC
jgi:hypothetical protein